VHVNAWCRFKGVLLCGYCCVDKTHQHAATGCPYILLNAIGSHVPHTFTCVWGSGTPSWLDCSWLDRSSRHHQHEAGQDACVECLCAIVIGLFL